MTKAKATWVLWIKWRNVGWRAEVKVTPIDGHWSGREYAKFISKRWQDCQWFDEGTHRILPAGRKPKGAK